MKSNFNKRLISYGIANDVEECDIFLDGALKTAEMFFEDEKESLIEQGKENLYHQYICRFSYGFTEGTIFRTIGVITRLMELGYSDDEIIKITEVTRERLDDMKSVLF